MSIVDRLRRYGPDMHGIYKDAMFDAADEIEHLRSALAEAREHVEDLTAQGCYYSGDGLDSSAISTYADALRYLASIGRVKITHDAGRRVLAEWTERTE